jgi:hypothetical protein
MFVRIDGAEPLLFVQMIPVRDRVGHSKNIT